MIYPTTLHNMGAHPGSLNQTIRDPSYEFTYHQTFWQELKDKQRNLRICIPNSSKIKETIITKQE